MLTVTLPAAVISLLVMVSGPMHHSVLAFMPSIPPSSFTRSTPPPLTTTTTSITSTTFPYIHIMEMHSDRNILVSTRREIAVARSSRSSIFQSNFRNLPRTHHTNAILLRMSNNDNGNSSSSLPVFLDPGTKGGVVVLSILLFILPLIIYQIATGPMGLDEVTVGRNIGVGFSVVTMLLWGSTYIFRVATKDMTYAKQLKDYEDAVIAKRLEELDDDEVIALVEDMERERF